MAAKEPTEAGENAACRRPLEAMTLRDAMIAVGSFAALRRSETVGNSADLVAEQAQAHPLFQNLEEGDDRLRARIQDVITRMGAETPERVLARAAGCLTHELREAAFGWAVAILGRGKPLAAEDRMLPGRLRDVLGLPSAPAERTPSPGN